MKKTITLLLISALINALNAQTAPSWVKYSGPADYANYDVQEVSTGTDSMGNIYTAASMSDTVNDLSKAMLVKYNPAGVQQWIQYYDNNDANFNGSHVKKLLVDPAGNCYLCGYGIGGSTNGKDFLLVKYDNAGSMQFSDYLDAGSNVDDYLTSARFDTHGNIILAGYGNHGGTTGDDIFVCSFTNVGSLNWSYLWNNTAGNDEDRALDVAADTTGNVFVTGSTYQSATGRDMVTLKVNATGNLQWAKIYSYSGDGNDDRGFSVVADAAGNSYVTGATADWITIKYDPSGNVLWNQHYTTFDLSRFDNKKVLLDTAGNVISVGNAFEGTSEQNNFVVNKYTKAGLLLWSANVNGPAGGESVEVMYDALVDSAGYIYVTGKYDGALSTDILTSVFSPAGVVVWNNPFANALNTAGDDRAYSIALDGHRNIILAGLAETRSSNSVDAVDVVTLKYNALQLSTAVSTIAANEAEVLLYPNPNHGNLTLSLTDQNLLGAVITVTNMLGQTVMVETLNNLKQQLNVSNVAKGLYMLNIKTGAQTISKKFMVE